MSKDDNYFIGFDPESPKKILVVSHSGFISELINLIRRYGNVKPVNKNETKNACFHVIRIYCSICGKDSLCKNTKECQSILNKLEFDHILVNECNHLSMLNEH